VAMEAIRQALLEIRINIVVVGGEDVKEIRANALSVVELSQGFCTTVSTGCFTTG
jgi:hypothetical protein